MMAMLSQTLEVVAAVFKGLVSLITSTLQIIAVIPQFLTFILSLIAVAPPFITTFMIVGVTASILFLIVGRN